MKYRNLMLLLVFITTSLFGVENIDKLMVEKASSPQEKKAVHKYLLKEAENKRKMATKFRELANIKRGGKAQSQIQHKKEMLQEAKSLEASAHEYEKLAKKIEEQN